MQYILGSTGHLLHQLWTFQWVVLVRISLGSKLDVDGEQSLLQSPKAEHARVQGWGSWDTPELNAAW